MFLLVCFLLYDTSTTELYTYCHTLSLHDAFPICFERFEKSRIKGSLLQYVEQPGHPPALADLGLDRGETPGFGQGFERGERYTVRAAPQQPNLVVPGNIGIEEQQFLSKLFPDGA